MGLYDLKLNYKRFDVTISMSCVTNSQDVGANKSNVTITATITRTSGSSTWWSSERTLTITCDGQSQSMGTKLPKGGSGTASYSASFDIQHNNDGTKTIDYTGSIPAGSTLPARSGSGTTTLPTIPRYANITEYNIDSRTETTITHHIIVDTYCSDTYYKIAQVQADGSYVYGPWISMGACGANERKTNTITGLSEGTKYVVGWKCKRGDSGQEREASGAMVVTTYKYPYIYGTQDFYIGDSYTIGLYNPLNRNCTLKVLDNSNNELGSISSITTNGYVDGPNDNTTIDNMYASIPDAQSGKYKIRLIVNEISRDVRYVGNLYKIKEAECLPTFSDFTYADVNATTLALTGSNQSIIPRYSNVTTTVSVANKATAKNYATMISYKFTCGDASDTASYSASSAVNMTINNVSSENFTVQAIDSRGLPTPITKTASTVVSYTDLVKDTSSTLKRTAGVSEAVTLTLKGTIWNQSFGSVTNSIKSVTYKYRILNSGDEYETGTTTITPTVANDGKFTFTGAILGDTNEGFDIENSYEVVVKVDDELSTISYTFVLAGGKPHIAYHKNGVSIMGAYVPANGGKLQIDGVNIENLLGGGGGLNIGSIIEFAGSNIPTGFLKCEGQSLSKSQYPDLFDVIGYTYGGSGNNFNLPNLKGRVPVGVDSNDTNFNALGKTYGDKTHAHNINGHTHHYGLRYLGFYGDTQLEGSSGVGIMNYSSDNNYTLSGYGASVGSVTTNNMNGGTTQSVQTVSPNAYQMEGDTSYTGMNTNNGSSYQPSFATYFIIKVENTVPVPQTSQVTSTYEESANDVYSCNYVNGKVGNVLYSNSTGTTSDFTLQDNVTNYKKIEVGYITNDSNQGIKTIYNNGDSVFYTEIFEIWTSSNTENVIYIKNAQLMFNGTNVLVGNGYETYLTSGTFSRSSANNISIKYVIGYK